MFQVRDPVFYFFLLLLGISFDFTLDAIYKCGWFPKTFPKKYFKFVSGRENGLITFDPDLILLSAEVDSFLEEQNCKKYMFVALATSCL